MALIFLVSLARERRLFGWFRIDILEWVVFAVLEVFFFLVVLGRGQTIVQLFLESIDASLGSLAKMWRFLARLVLIEAHIFACNLLLMSHFDNGSWLDHCYRRLLLLNNFLFRKIELLGKDVATFHSLWRLFLLRRWWSYNFRRLPDYFRGRRRRCFLLWGRLFWFHFNFWFDCSRFNHWKLLFR